MYTDMHKPEDLDHNCHVNFRPQVFNEPVAAVMQPEQSYKTTVHDEVNPQIGNYRDDDSDDELFATSARPGARAAYKNQLGYPETQSGGGNPSSRQQTAPDRFAAGRQRQAIHDEVTTTRVQRAPRSKSQPPPRHSRFNEPPPRPPPIPSRPSPERHYPANPATMRSDRHPHSNRTGAPDHFQRATDGARQREYLPPRAFGFKGAKGLD